jgi:hypothetical protein
MIISKHFQATKHAKAFVHNNNTNSINMNRKVLYHHHHHVHLQRYSLQNKMMHQRLRITHIIIK